MHRIAGPSLGAAAVAGRRLGAPAAPRRSISTDQPSATPPAPPPPLPPLAQWVLSGSPVTRARTAGGQAVCVKRDDLLGPLAGNKARKLRHLLAQPSAELRGLVSYGGVQSNFMLALAQVGAAKGLPVQFLVRSIPERVRRVRAAASPRSPGRDGEQATSNYHQALALGATVTAGGGRSDALRGEARRLAGELGHRFVAQGGHESWAGVGLRDLARELVADVQRLVPEVRRPVAVVVPCGRGTTAFYLHQHIQQLGAQDVARVAAVPVCGGSDYLREQWAELGAGDAGATGSSPISSIAYATTAPVPSPTPPWSPHGAGSSDAAAPPLVIDTPQRFPFGVPHPALLAEQQRLAAQGLAVDLVYAPKAWLALRHHFDSLSAGGTADVWYLHTGGLSGNASMLARYDRS